MAAVIRLCVFVSLLYSVECLRCYTCSEESDNGACSAVEHLVECGVTQDACLTSVVWSSVDGKMINKFCYWQVECPTALQSPWPCDPRENAWACSTCCTESDCNYSDSSQTSSSSGFAAVHGVIIPLCLTFWLF